MPPTHGKLPPRTTGLQVVPANPAVPDRPAPVGREASLSRAEARGRQVLLYAPLGPLGGTFACSRCGASALQPDLLTHHRDCPYGSPQRRGDGALGTPG